MTRLSYVGDLYAVSGSIGSAATPLDIFAIADPSGASLDRAVRELGRQVREGSIALLTDLLTVARRLRWRVSIEPFPSRHSQDRNDLVAELANLASQCRLMVGADTRWILDTLLRAANAVNSDAAPPLGEFLLQSLNGLGSAGAVLVLSGARTAGGTRSWLRELDAPITVPVVSDRDKGGPDVYDKAYLIGAPSVFGATAFGAPRARNLAYLFPSWIQDRELPTSDFSSYAEGGLRPRTQLHRIGQEAFIPERLRNVEDRLIPEPVWRQPKPRLPAGEAEVHARRVLLCGGLSIMLDLEGDTIRTLDPSRPAGRRVGMSDVAAVGPGTYLVLREGQTESGPLYTRTLARLGADAGCVEESQAGWKGALQRQLQALGPAEVVRRLHARGVQAAAQAPAWTAQTLARPRSDADFAILLQWLELPEQPYRQHAGALRQARSQASADVRDALEGALGEADMGSLQQVGILRLDLDLEGFAGIIATRVIAISPYLDVVPRSELRIPKEDASSRWLE